MHTTSDALASQKAAQQAGVIGRRQARDVGLSDRQIQRRVATSERVRILPGAFAFSAVPLTWWSWSFAAVVSLGTGGVLLAGLAAAVRRWVEPRFPITVAVPRESRPRWPREKLLAMRVPVASHEVVNADGLPITTRARTAADIAHTLPLGAAQDVLDRLLVLGHITLPELTEAVYRSKRNGAAQARHLVATAADRAASTAERLAQRLFQDAGLLAFVANYPVRCGRQVWKIDIAFVAAKVAVEINGWAIHRLPDRGRADYAKSADLQAAGWLVLTFTWNDLIERPHAVIERGRAALQGRELRTTNLR